MSLTVILFVFYNGCAGLDCAHFLAMLIEPFMLQPVSSLAPIDAIANGLLHQGYYIAHDLIPIDQCFQMLHASQQLPEHTMHSAKIGRHSQKILNEFVRRDNILWLEPTTPVFGDYVRWLDEVRLNLSRNLMISLPLMESQLAHYSPGDFYKKHLDSFTGNPARKISCVLYLNPNWKQQHGGELVVYSPKGKHELFRLLPSIGTMIFFRSEIFPHQVLPATKDRFSIATWMRQREIV